jgi:hypothetical protein
MVWGSGGWGEAMRMKKERRKNGTEHEGKWTLKQRKYYYGTVSYGKQTMQGG